MKLEDSDYKEIVKQRIAALSNAYGLRYPGDVLEMAVDFFGRALSVGVSISDYDIQSYLSRCSNYLENDDIEDVELDQLLFDFSARYNSWLVLKKRLEDNFSMYLDSMSVEGLGKFLDRLTTMEGLGVEVNDSKIMEIMYSEGYVVSIDPKSTYKKKESKLEGYFFVKSFLSTTESNFYSFEGYSVETLDGLNESAVLNGNEMDSFIFDVSEVSYLLKSKLDKIWMNNEFQSFVEVDFKFRNDSSLIRLIMSKEHYLSFNESFLKRGKPSWPYDAR